MASKNKPKPSKQSSGTNEKVPPVETQTPPPPPPVAAVGSPELPLEETTGLELVAPLVAGMPTPTEGVDESPAAPPPPPSAGVSPPPATPPPVGQVDLAGVPFDPDKHAVDEQGRPKTNKHGNFYHKNTGKGRHSGKPGSETPRFNFTGTNAPPPPPPPPQTTGTATPIRQPDRFDAAAALYFMSFCGALTAFFGDDGWMPENNAEKEGMIETVATYLRASNRDDLPPGVVLALAVGVYSSKRITRPKTSERLGILWFRVKSWLGWDSQPHKAEETDAGKDGES